MPISYAPTSWNPMVGCTPESEACDNCWARMLHEQRHKVNIEAGAAFGPTMGHRMAKASVAVHARDLGAKLPMPPQYDVPFNKIQLFPERLAQPLRWRKPRTVAVCFMGDLFHEQVPDEFISQVFAVMAMAPQHSFLLLTKRAERMRQYLHEMTNDPEAYVWAWAREASNVFLDGAVAPSAMEVWPLPNVWLGVTAENQRMADERIPLLLDTPAAHRWVSLEPLLEPVDLTMLNLGVRPMAVGSFDAYLDALNLTETNEMGFDYKLADKHRLDWVVVGGESGPGHRPMGLKWARSIVTQCQAANIPVYFKQIAASRPGQPSGVAALDSAKETPWN